MRIKLLLLLFFMILSGVSVNAQKIDVWDFGAVQLDNTLYNNQLSIETINGWYTGVTPGSTNISFPTSFTAGILSWVGASGDRLRTSNLSLTRYDTNIASVTAYTGRVYCNGTAAVSSGIASNRYMSMTLTEDDEVTIIARGDTEGMLTFAYTPDYTLQKDVVPITSTSGSVTVVKFVAKRTGTYRIYDATAKASFYRILRKSAKYASITGAVDVTQAPGIPSGYSILFTNSAGKVWSAPVNSGTYSVNLPAAYTYQMSLSNANGYIINNGETLQVSETTTNHDVVILKVDLFTVSGAITGLGTDISKLSLTYTPNSAANKTFVPKPVINTSNSTYTVELEPNTEYTISAQGVNDYSIPSNKITIANTSSADVVFTAKSVYPVTINTTGLEANQLSNLKLTFTNLNENGYVYNFNSPSVISLRNGTYSIASSGLDDYPVEMGLISNLKVNAAGTSKSIDFKHVNIWSFDDKAISTTTTASYKGMLFTGTVATRVANGDLTAKSGATIKVPVKPGDKVSITYYYTADFSIDGGATISTASNSTNVIENVEYTYTGSAAGYVTITVGAGVSTTYFTHIEIGGSAAYVPVIYVGVDKEYKTINGALTAVSKMIRNNNQRVTIMIDPGNYEEMLDITQTNVTLKNAASNPNINLLNKGVDIGSEAVRITSYYGMGYSYYSMKNNQKWDADVLKVNKENGFLSYENQGGTTNNSYWNATLIVSANGFEAENIIIENSFNQYISKKESEDIVEMWAVGGKGIRPTTYGSTAVQDKSFVERAAAIAIKNNIDKVVLNKCRIVGRQDSFFGGTGARVAVYKGAMMGAVDYIFGGMNAVFYRTDLVMNTSDSSSDASYLTAAQQTSGRGYLMYECTITSAIPGVETASVYRSKPGYFGRPWAANTSEVVFYNTTVETSNYPGFIGQSLIMPLGWSSSLSGESNKMYEYGTIENSGVNNQSNRASWSTVLTSPTLTDGTVISTFNFTKGNDGWDPFPELISNESLKVKKNAANSSVDVVAYSNRILVSNVKSATSVTIYSVNGAVVKSFVTDTNVDFEFKKGVWIVVIKAADGFKSVKIVTH